MPETNLRVGLCGIGLDAYWPQFEGLRARLESYIQEAGARLGKFGAAVEHLGMVDTPQRGREAGHACRRADVDLLVIYVTTYALSSTVLPMVQCARVPILILNLQPDASIDYEVFNRLPNRTAMTGEWLAFCSACPVPEIANVLSRAGNGVSTGKWCSDRRCSVGGDWRMDRRRTRKKGAEREPARPDGTLLQRDVGYPDRFDAGLDHVWKPR
jgi:L-arabinose isomerase